MFRSVKLSIEAALNRSAQRRWQKRARTAQRLNLSTLSDVTEQAEELRSELDKFMFVSKGRLALPRLGSNAMQLPLYTDFSLRPELWRGPIRDTGQASVGSNVELGSETKLYHDCELSEITYRQVRNTRDDDMAPFGLVFDVFRFSGSFLSLAVNYSEAACQGLNKTHVIRADLRLEVEKKLEVFARLNIKHGPNYEKIVREISFENDRECFVEFDLAYTKLDEKRIEDMWIDIIFENPQMNHIGFRDLVLSRHPRAEA